MKAFHWTPEYVGDVLPLAKGIAYLNLLNAEKGPDGAPSGYAVEEILAAANAA